MIFKNYKDFLENRKINENVQQAKVFLKKKALADKMEMTGKEAALTPEEIKAAENNKDFLKIKEMLRDNPGYVYAFVKFYFDLEIPFEELKEMYSRIKEYKSMISTLPMPVERYADVVPDESDKRNGFERLGDDITKLELKRITKKFVDRLPGDFVVTNPNAPDKGVSVPSIRRAYQNAPDAVKEKVAGIAKAFDEFGRDLDGSIDAAKNKELQDLFFNKVQRYRNLNEVIQAALNHIKATNNSNIVKFLNAIEKVNERYGFINGAEIIYEKGDIIIIEVKSFHANKELNGNTAHCIASNSFQWDNYVGADSNFNKQYYIYNFALSPGNNDSVIGITIEPNLNIRACHKKDDSNFVNGIKTYLKNIGVDFEILRSMTKEEIELKKKRVIANKEIVMSPLSDGEKGKKITIEDIERLINDGADPSAKQGTPLINSVREDDLEKTKRLLELGAQPNVGSAIKYSKNLDMIKLLVSFGATVTNEVFESIANDYEGVKYVINAGMDVNFDSGAPLRKAIKVGNKDVIRILFENKADPSLRRWMGVRNCIDNLNTDLLEFLKDLCLKYNQNPRLETFMGNDSWIKNLEEKSGASEVRDILIDWFRQAYPEDYNEWLNKSTKKSKTKTKK